jgi:hemerythrin-like domain-containing protein
VSGPMTIYLLMHSAIEREMAHLENLSADLSPSDAAGLTELAERVAFLRETLLAHEAAEERVMFPALENRHPLITASYRYDHEHYGPNGFDLFQADLAALVSGNGTGSVEIPRRLHRTAVALNEHLRLHIAKENELLVPALEREFDVDELSEILTGMRAEVGPELMGRIVVWMFRDQGTAERLAMVQTLEMLLPSEAFAGITSRFGEIDPDGWAQLRQPTGSRVT